MKKFGLLIIISVGFFCTSKAQSKQRDSEVAVDVTQVIPDTSKIYTSVEVLPLFPNGTFNSYLAKNIKWPEKNGMDVQGKVITTFIIERDGRITNAKVIRSLSPFFDAEALRVINSSPKWRPGTIGGKAVRVQFIVAVPFQIEN